MVLGDAFSKLEGHNLVSVYPKSIILGQMTNLNMIFHVVVSVYRLVKIWNSPQFPDEFRNGHELKMIVFLTGCTVGVVVFYIKGKIKTSLPITEFYMPMV